MNALSEWLMWAVGGVAAALTPVAGVVKGNRDRSVSNKRQLEGDPNDPNQEGVLAISYETREKLEEFRRETRLEHEAVMERLDELDDDAGDG